MTITAAVDGSALGNPGPAGWAWVVSDDCWAAGGWAHATNNIGELTAVLELLRATVAAGLADEELHILADSQYAINVLTKWRHSWKHRGWRKADNQPIKNLELIQDLDAAMQGRNVTFEWVKGHAGDYLNELADTHARSAAEAYRDGRTIPSGPGFGVEASDVAGAPSSGGVGDGLPIYGTTLAPIPGGDPQLDGEPTDWGDVPLEPFGSYLMHDEGGADFGDSLLLDEENLPEEFALDAPVAHGSAMDEAEEPGNYTPALAIVNGDVDELSDIGDSSEDIDRGAVKAAAVEADYGSTDDSEGEPGPAFVSVADLQDGDADAPPSTPTDDDSEATGTDSAAATPLPSRRSRKTRAKNGAAPAEPAITEADMIGAQEALIEAWAAREEGTLQALTAPGCRRIWPNGQVRSSLLGPVPPNPQIAGIEANALGAGTWLVRHLLTWEGGASVETTIWLTGSGAMQVIHHQSTLVRQ